MHRTDVCPVPAQGPTLSEPGTVQTCAEHCPECFRSGLFFDPENAFGRCKQWPAPQGRACRRFIAEEAAASGAKCVLTHNPTWIIDPIDGTCNFVHRFPTVAVSIGFAVRQELEFGVIYHCTEERLYTGRRGGGAFCNGQRLRVSGETDLSKALVLTEIGPKRDPATLKLFLSNMERLLHAKAHGVRVIGSSTLALCHLASGAADAYYQFGLHCWDLAAATVIIREAGGIVIDTSGGPLDLMACRVVAASTREMAMLIAQALQTINYGRDDEK
uniref:Inositol-1-monophosphatase n=1 Tax=Papio anubis TaxID=9555 RepID=A0A8I5N5G4_PAPAN